MVRAKFKLTSITEHDGYGAKTLKFTVQYDMSIPEDVRFAKATPCGTLEMYVDNPVALERLKLGEQYYLDFTEVPKAT
jgi:hypothetical protein